MAYRKVTQTKKDDDRDILALCNPDKDWSPRWRSKAISDIEDNDHTYYVDEDDKWVDIVVAKDENGKKYLRTDPDETIVNNLDYLPDC